MAVVDSFIQPIVVEALLKKREMNINDSQRLGVKDVEDDEILLDQLVKLTDGEHCEKIKNCGFFNRLAQTGRYLKTPF